MASRNTNSVGSTSRHRLRCFALVLALALPGAIAPPALAEDVGAKLGGFSPFFEAAPHVVVQRGRGSADSNYTLSARKSNYLTNLAFRLGGGVKAPAIDAWWGRPRPLVYAAALVPINESSTIGAQLIKSRVAGFEVVEDSKFAIEYQTSATAGLGLEFTVPVGDFDIGITPSIESLHMVSRYTGEASYVKNFQAPGFPSEVHAARVKQEITQHFLGPAIRISTAATQVSGVSIDFFLSASLLFDVVGTHERVAVAGENGDQTRFNFETGTGLVQLSSGFQLRWP